MVLYFQTKTVWNCFLGPKPTHELGIPLVMLIIKLKEKSIGEGRGLREGNRKERGGQKRIERGTEGDTD